MSAFGILLLLSAICVVCAVMSAMLISADLEQRGITTPFLFARALFFRNLSRYRQITRSETGEVGPLFYSYVVSINAVWILALAAYAARVLG
jgi:hypothetical protein